MFIQKRTRDTIDATNLASECPATLPRTAVALALVAALSLPAVLPGCSPVPTGAPSGSSQTSSSATSSTSQQAASADEVAAETIMVNVTVNASAVQEEGWDAYLRGINGPYNLPAGSTAFDALMATDADVVEDGGYVTAIDGLRTGEFGPSSGWMYSVNDENPFIAAKDYQLHDGDSVRWYYSR